MSLYLYGLGKSRSLRCEWMLEELEVPYKFVSVALMEGEGRSPEYLAINPCGKVPALRDGELTLFESAAICTYLGDKFPDANLVPRAGSAERGIYNQWMFYCMAELEQPLWIYGKHTFVYPEAHRVMEILPSTAREFKRAKKVVSQALADRKYLLGEQFTAADVLVGQTLMWAKSGNFELDCEILEAYVTLLKVRPAFQRTMQKLKSRAS
jgi:glutathione S-transferase